jgi:phytoene/squalene synthetase
MFHTPNMMRDLQRTTPHALLAKSITWKGSKLTYLIGCIFVDRDLREDFFRAYAYFRWLDDIVDDSNTTRQDRLQFVMRQDSLIRCLFSGETWPSVDDLCPQEELLVQLTQARHHHSENLRSFVENMFAIIKFDAHRKDHTISSAELDWYSQRLARSVVDGLQYFIGNNHDYPRTENQYSAAMAAHITHLLRDTIPDIANGFINIPHDVVLEGHIQTTDHPAVRNWVKDRVILARRHFQDGREYIRSLPVKRCQLASYLYCNQFERILNVIEHDGYIVRHSYE